MSVDTVYDQLNYIEFSYFFLQNSHYFIIACIVILTYYNKDIVYISLKKVENIIIKGIGVDEDEKIGVDEDEKIGVDEVEKIGVDEAEKIGEEEGKKEGKKEDVFKMFKTDDIIEGTKVRYIVNIEKSNNNELTFKFDKIDQFNIDDKMPKFIHDKFQ